MVASAPVESADATALETLSRQDVEAMLQATGTQMLGAGSYGSVYAVQHRRQTCALKCAHSNGVIPLWSEMKWLQSIAGAGGAPVPLASCPESPALLMSFCGKENLREYLRKGARSGGFSLEHVLSLALRVTERLQDLHRAGVVHGDLKANNVTLRLNAAGNPESVHIIDFGLSPRAGETRPPKRDGRDRYWYCSCMDSGSPLSPLCDLPGLGAIFYKLFMGRPDVPRGAADLAKLCARRFHDERRPALEEVRRRLAEVFVSLLPSEEERRAPAAKEARILAQFCADAGLPTVAIPQLHQHLRPPHTVAEGGDGKTFHTGQRVVKHAGNLRAFKDLLLEAMELRALDGRGRGSQRLEGVCIETPSALARTRARRPEWSRGRSPRRPRASAPAETRGRSLAAPPADDAQGPGVRPRPRVCLLGLSGSILCRFLCSATQRFAKAAGKAKKA